ncbi:hypothetical protein D9758_008198 [Tetrapyrgos nigripes]|uniref:Uncharacterized protein n=1 Tax=Tetrapyrgos nigripes TaxID=182062 RepID=A0A8H5G1I1_9AGAR|nr:hypothetical protein D9758_008198 [Tetrapyrgos nigripes]
MNHLADTNFDFGNHLHSAHCLCRDESSARRLQQRMAEVSVDPGRAVQLLSDAQGQRRIIDPFHLNALSNLIKVDERVRRAGAVSLFIRFLTDGYDMDPAYYESTSVTDCRYWELPLMGLTNVLAMMATSPANNRDDRAIVEEIAAAFLRILDKVLPDLSEHLPANVAAEFRRHTCMTFITNFAQHAVYRERCLVYCSRQTLSQDYHEFLALDEQKIRGGRIPHPDSQLDPRDFPQFNASIGIDDLVAQLEHVFADPAVVGKNLASEMEALKPFLFCGLPGFTRKKIHKSIINAFLRHFETGPPNETVRLNHTISFVLYELPEQAEDFVSYQTEMIRDGFIHAFAKGFVFSASIGYDGYWTIFLQHRGIPGPDNQNWPLELRALLNDRLESVYFWVLYSLQKFQNPKAGRYLAMWTELGVKTNMTEERLLKKWAEKRQCMNVGCVLRDSPKEATISPQQCTRCKQAYYHNQECQKM